MLVKGMPHVTFVQTAFGWRHALAMCAHTHVRAVFLEVPLYPTNALGFARPPDHRYVTAQLRLPAKCYFVIGQHSALEMAVPAMPTPGNFFTGEAFLPKSGLHGVGGWFADNSY